MKELISQIPNEALPYWIIPIGMAQLSSQKQYKKYRVANNDQQNSLRGIPVVGLHPSCLDWEMKNDQEVTITMRGFFRQHNNLLSIKATNGTAEQGRYLVIVENEKYEDALQYLTKCFGEYFPTLSQITADYDKYYGYFPRLQANPFLGGCIQSKVDKLVAAIDSAETGGTSLPARMHNAWQAPNPKITFDLADPTELTSVRTNSGSAHGSVAPDQSYAPRSIASTDLRTVVSNLESVVSQQSKLITAFMTTAQAQMDRRTETTEKNMAMQNETI